MANIDIAERLFVYAREKQQRDLANNLIKEEDVIDFNESDFTSFNNEISIMLAGMDTEQINMFASLLQTKMDHNITEVITPGEKGFSLNISSIVSTIKQVKEKSEPIETTIPVEEKQEKAVESNNEELEKKLDSGIKESCQKDIENLSKFGPVSELFIKIYTAPIEEIGKIIFTYTPEQLDEVAKTSEENLGMLVANDPKKGKLITREMIKALNLPPDLWNRIQNDPYGMSTLIFFVTNVGAHLKHGYLLNSDNTINENALLVLMKKMQSEIPEDNLLYQLAGMMNKDIAIRFDSLLQKNEYSEEFAQTEEYEAVAQTLLDNRYNNISHPDELHLKMSSLLRQELEYDGSLPPAVEERINDFVKKYYEIDQETKTYKFPDGIDFEEFNQLFKFDLDENPEILNFFASDEHFSKLLSPEELKEQVGSLLEALPSVMTNVVKKSIDAAKVLDALKYTAEDMKNIRPILEKFSQSEIILSNDELCKIINDSTQRESQYTHVNVENILQQINSKSKEANVEFAFDNENYQMNSSELTATLNNITFYRSRELLENDSWFHTYNDIQKYDINHFSSTDLRYDDVSSYLGEKGNEIRLTKAYKKFFPSKSAVDNGFLFDMDVQLLKMTDLDFQKQLDIYTDHTKNSEFVSFASALSYLYSSDGKNISSTIDRKQQEKNLEILKSEFLKSIDKSTLDSITIDTMAPIVNSIINNTMQMTATAISDHIDYKHFEALENYFMGNSTITVDSKHPGFLKPESYKQYSENIKKSVMNKESSTVNVSQLEDSKEDNHPIEQKKPRGLIGFVSSFVNKFRDTDKESGLFNRLKDSFNYAKDSISDYSNTNEGNINKEGFKPNQNTNSGKPVELDSFSQSLRNEFGDTTHTTPNNDGKNISEAQKKSSDGRANSDEHDEMDM